MSLVLQRAVDECKRIFDQKRQDEYNEAKVTDKFVRPVFEEVLGWDFKSEDVRPQRQTPSGPVDYAFEIDHSTKFLLEIKKLGESLDGYRLYRGKPRSHPEQAINYAWQLQVDWVVLSNFYETRLYWTHVKKPPKGLVLQIGFQELLGKFESFSVLARERVEQGSLRKLEKVKDRENITVEFLEDLLAIRQELTENINKKNSELRQDLLRESVQKIMDRLIVTRVAEDKEIIGFESLTKQLEAWKQRGLPSPFMRDLKAIFRGFDDSYNTKLFEAHLCEDLVIENKVLTDTIELLNKYNFNAISADVLGAIYENYIGHVLVRSGKRISIKESHDVRKQQGIYYTPVPIVDFIVRKALLPKLRGSKSIDEVKKIRVLDPACGSGSFLIKAYDFLKDWYDEFYRNLATAGKSSLYGYGVHVGPWDPERQLVWS